MRRLPGIRRLPRIAPIGRSIERDIDDEMRFHVAMRIEELIKTGYSEHDAKETAMREYGDIDAARRELSSIDKRMARRQSWREWIASVFQDLRFAGRSLANRPAFALTVFLTLALGVGANAAIFSVVDAVLLQPPPFRQPDRLLTVWESYQSRVDSRSEASYPDYLDWRARSKVFSDLGGYYGGSYVYGAAQPITVAGAHVTANFFDVVGVHAIIGRTFVAGEDAVGAPHVVMATYGFWKRALGADPEIAGRTITLDGVPATVVGVLPPGFQLAGRPAAAELVAPIDRSEEAREQRGNHWLNVVARLRPGATIDNGRQDMSSIMRSLAAEYPPTNAHRDALIVPLQEEMVGQVRPILLLLYGAVIVVLLVACVNVANLLLMRGADRQREIAVRIALGAGKGRLVRQLLTESVLLSVCGGLFGLIIAWAGVPLLLGLVPPSLAQTTPALARAGLDGRVVAYALVVSLAAGVGFGLVPALRMTTAGLSGVLKNAARGAIGGGSRMRDTLVVGELALTVMLMSGALLFGRSVSRLMAIDSGFQPDRVITATIALPRSQYADARAMASFFDRFVAQMREVPGVQDAAVVTKLPLDFGNSTSFRILGQPVPKPGENPGASYRSITPGYFSTMGIPVIRGRAFGAADDVPASRSVIVNRALVQAYLPNVDAVGQVLIAGGDSVTIVGVVGNVPIGRVEETIPPTLYLPFAAATQTVMSLAVRTPATADQMAPVIRRVLSGIDRNAAVTAPVSMETLIVTSPSVFMRRFPLYLVSTFAVTALLLAIVGIYGVVSYSVAQRTREMGIRMALGAQPGSVMGLVMRQGGRMAAVGIIAGIAGSLVLGHFAASLLYGVTPSDPVTYAVVAVALAAVAIAATIIPARRATRVDPATALRTD